VLVVEWRCDEECDARRRGGRADQRQRADGGCDLHVRRDGRERTRERVGVGGQGGIAPEAICISHAKNGRDRSPATSRGSYAAAMETRAYNRAAWDHAVATGDRWTVPVGPDVISAAREGDWSIVLTPTKPVPRAWFGELDGADVLCLASGGGQQGPILAATGATVTVFDNSPAQLAQDRLVATRDSLAITTVEGDMADLSCFPDASFDLIVHPCSNLFVESVLPVWKESARVLRQGGTLLAGFCQPILFCFDEKLEADGIVQMKYAVPFSGLTSTTTEERRAASERNDPLEFGHTLQDQIGGQLDAGLVLTGFFEDGHVEGSKLNDWLPTFVATRAAKA
jgi:SAM-dependent methyltransferase